MRHETAMGAAFKKADATVSHMQAYTLAAKMLRDAGGERAAAAPLALKKFLAALTADEDLLRGCALGFLQFVAMDMKGDVTGQVPSATRYEVASAPPPDRDGSRHPTDARPTSAPAREPSTSQKQAAGTIRRLMAESVLTSMRVRDGRAIGRIYRSEIPDMIGENWRENAILDRVRKIPLPDGKNDARIGDYVTDVQMKRILAEVDQVAA